MGTKNKPGKYDCYDKLGPDEPFFVLRAQDQLAPPLIDLWCDKALIGGASADKIKEARALAQEMRGWKGRRKPT